MPLFYFIDLFQFEFKICNVVIVSIGRNAKWHDLANYTTDYGEYKKYGFYGVITHI